MNKGSLRKMAFVTLCAFTLCGSVRAASGLIHNWKGDGDANDSVGTANGTITNLDGSTNIDVTFATGQVGQAFSFDGNGLIDCGTTNVAAFADGDFAIGFWVQVSGSGAAPLVSKYSYGIGYDVDFANGGITCNLQGSNGVLSVSSLSRVDDGNFHHVVVERNTTNLYVFIDGVISGKSIGTDIINMPELPYVQQTNEVAVYDDMGNAVTNSDGSAVLTNEVDVVSAPASFQIGAGFTGLLDEIEVYPRALTAYEVYSVSHPGVGLAIIDQPLNQRGLAGRPILLHLLAVGVDPITYQWQFNGYDIPGAISNNLVLDSPQTFDSGTYTVVVSNPTGDMTSQPATLTITNLSTPTMGLIARWSGEGTANDSAGNHNGVTSNIRYVPGVLGTAFQFNGKSSVRCGNVLGNIGTQDFTVDFWMQTTSDAPSGDVGIPIVGQRPWCDGTDCFEFRLMKSGSSLNYIFTELGDHRNSINPLYNYTGVQSVLSSFHLNDGVFHHIATTRSSNVLSLYIDGTFVNATFTREPVVLNNSGSFDLGVGPCGNAFVGSLDEVEVFNRALSDNEIFNTYSPNPSLSIVRQPKTASAVENTATSLTVSAAGMDPISYQWRLNGVDIPGATSSAYSMASVQLSDAGIYTVMASNPVATKVSAPAEFTVVPANSVLPGLLNRWSAEGNFLDAMGKNPASGQARFAPGVSGQGWKFDGVFDIVGTDYTTGQFGFNDFTWAMWIRYERDGTLLATMPAYRFSADRGMIRAQLGDGSRDMYGPNIMNDTNTTFSTNAAVPINDGKFHHVAFVRQDTTNFLIYIDGTNALQTVIPVFDLEDQWGLSFCDDYGRSQRFAGTIDEAEDYNRALTPDEVLSLYTKYANGPRADYALQEISSPLGSSFTLNAGPVSGGGPVTYQWTLNGVPIAGATDSTYTVGSVDTSTPGIYAVTMTTANGSISSPLARVSIQLSPGNYNGLFYLDNDVTDDSAGYITLTLDVSQTYSAQIVTRSKTYHNITGKFAGTNTTLHVNRGTLSPWTIELSGISSNKITGVVHDATRRIPLEAHRAVYSDSHPTPQAGSYTIQLTGMSSPNAPNGHGFGNLTISPNGKMSFIANLADDMTISQGTALANLELANSDVWPFFIPAYGGKGSVMGWLSFTNKNGSIPAGTLRWIKGAAPLTKNYKRGFATRIPAIGSRFTPATTGLGIGLNNSAVVLDAAKIYTPLDEPILGTNADGSITFSQVGTTQKGKLSVTSRYGRFSGLFYNPLTGKNSPVKGIVMQDQAYAAGYFISSNLSGRVVLQHN